MRIVLDCANGAAYKVAPTALWELGAEVISIASQPNGFNINEGCGSTNPEYMCSEVRKHRADIGIALDGDADRVIIADETGNLIDSDQILALIATHWSNKGTLRGDGIVASIMSNLGLERYLNNINLKLHRSPVGDRYLVQEMRNRNINLAGESSGHIVMSDFATTGDGLIAALQILAVQQASEQPLSKLAKIFDPVPQLLRNVPIGSDDPLQKNNVQAAINSAHKRLENRGRLVIRKSGTESMVRVMGEREDETLVHDVVGSVATAIEQAA